MKKILVAVVFMLAVVTSLAFAVEPKESFTIEKLKNKKAGVVFPHKKHSAEFGIKCAECHHTMKADTETPQSCFECHKDKETDIPGVGKAPAAGTTKKDVIFHAKCIECHKAKDKGPKKCKECHPGGDDD